MRWDRDGYEGQREAAGGVLAFPERSAEALLGEVGDILLREPHHSPADWVRGLAEQGRAAGESVQTVLVANYASGSVAALPVRPDGSLGEAASFVRHQGSSVNPRRQKEPHAHCIAVSPDNRFALAADLGTDQVLVYRLDPAAAKLTPHDPPFARAPAGAGPRHLAFHPGGKHVYVVNELLNSVSLFDYDAEAGTLAERQTVSTLPEGFAGASACADVKLTPDGRTLYASNRGHDSIATFRVGADGRLARVAITPSGGRGPQNLAVTPGGRWLLCANRTGDSLTVFRIDPATGRLAAAGEPVAQPGPSCILVVP